MYAPREAHRCRLGPSQQWLGGANMQMDPVSLTYVCRPRTWLVECIDAGYGSHLPEAWPMAMAKSKSPLRGPVLSCLLRRSASCVGVLYKDLGAAATCRHHQPITATTPLSTLPCTASNKHSQPSKQHPNNNHQTHNGQGKGTLFPCTTLRHFS